jgi:radial spoke head protein 1
MVYPDGGKYAGAFVDGKRHGHGVYYYPNGDRFSGAWERDNKHGQGTYVHGKSHSQLIGTWVNGQCVSGQWHLHDGQVVPLK